MVPILQKEHPLLRARAREIRPDEFGITPLIAVLRSMHEALDAQDDGVAIAAPQIGESLRIFIISKKVFARRRKDKIFENVVCINPVITKMSREKKPMTEGCLSVRWLYGNVDRAAKATIVAYNERGEKFTMGGSGLLAQAFQHEIDHLDGILFIDKATNIEEVPPPDTSHANA